MIDTKKPLEDDPQWLFLLIRTCKENHSNLAYTTNFITIFAPAKDL